MIGILLALQVNNWNEWRKDRVKEVEVLMEIRTNIQNNIGFLEQNMRMEESWSDSYRIMMDVIKQDFPWHDTLKYHARPAIHERVPTLSFSAYESLRNKGVDIILSDGIQKAIYETNYNDLITIMSRVANIEIKPITAAFVVDNFQRVSELASEERIAFIPNDPKELLSNQKYLNILTYVQGYRNGLFQGLQVESLRQSERVLHLIKDELGE